MLDKMQVDFDYTIKEELVGSARVFTIDSEFDLASCNLTNKYEAKVVTVSGITEITKPLVSEGVFICLIWKHTRFAYRIAFLPSAKREDIIVK